MTDLGPVVVNGFTDDRFIELARAQRGQKGKLYRKQVLRFGSMAHPNIPGQKLTIDEKFADSLIKNFQDGVCPIVQVPIVGKDNQHTEDPRDNLGEVLGVEKTKEGVDVIIDARKHAEDLGKTLIGASAFMHLNYPDTKTGKKVGPSLLHVAVTNRPYVTDLNDFEDVIAASADIDSEKDLILFSPQDEKEPKPMTKEEMLAALKKEHDIDIEALLKASTEQPPADNPDQTSPPEQPEAPKPEPKKDEPEAPAEPKKEPEPVTEPKTEELVQALSAVLKANENLKLSAKDDSEITFKDVAEAVVEMAQDNVKLSASVQELQQESKTLKTERATTEIDGLVKTGRVLPAQKEAMLELSLTNRVMFEKILPDVALVSLSEEGVTVHDDVASEKLKVQSEDIDRLAELAKQV